MFAKIPRLAAIRLGLILATGFAGLSFAQNKVDEALPLEELRIFSEVFGKIKSEYVEPVDDATLLKGAIHGMVRQLDPHSAFLDPEEFKEFRITTDGKFGGLGIEVTIEDGLIKVISPMDGTPAFYAGIRPGDLILMLDGAPVRGMSLKEAVDKMRGPPGSEIMLTISRAGEPPMEVVLVRAVIRAASVKAQLLEGGFGYARLSSFQSGSARSLRTEIAELKNSNGAPLEGFVLDLRNNSGGVLSGAVEVSDLFLGSGEIVSTRGRTGLSEQSYSAQPDDVIDNAPMVVLVNGGSASASEIVSGALQDHHRAIIMGTKTFGKGSVQTIIPMGGNRGALKITTARYYTPSGRSIQTIGITPDIVTERVELAKLETGRPAVGETDPAVHSDNPIVSDEVDVKAEADVMENDNQLKEAFNLLKGMALVRKRTSAVN